MTVKELIEKLQEFPMNAVVMVKEQGDIEEATWAEAFALEDFAEDGECVNILTYADYYG